MTMDPDFEAGPIAHQLIHQVPSMKARGLEQGSTPMREEQKALIQTCVMQKQSSSLDGSSVSCCMLSVVLCVCRASP